MGVNSVTVTRRVPLCRLLTSAAAAFVHENQSLPFKRRSYRSHSTPVTNGREGIRAASELLNWTLTFFQLTLHSVAHEYLQKQRFSSAITRRLTVRSRRACNTLHVYENFVTRAYIHMCTTNAIQIYKFHDSTCEDVKETIGNLLGTLNR